MNQLLENIHLKPVRESLGIKKTEGIIDLSVGEGHFNSPFTAKLKAYEALIKNETKYGAIEGEEQLREALIKRYYPMYSVDNMIITHGSTQGLYAVLNALLNPGDEVILVSPHYPVYEHEVRLLGGNPIIIDTKDNGFKLSVELLAPYVNAKTKALIINEPNNPTGLSYSEEEKRKFLEFFEYKNLFIIIDEVYRDYGFNFVSFSTLLEFYKEDLRDRYIFVNSLSKSHLMTGYRIGFVVGSISLMKELYKLNYLHLSCVSKVIQEAALGALSEDDYVQFVHKYYCTNREIVTKTLDDLGVQYVKVVQGYYVFIDISPFHMTGIDFCSYMYKTHKILLVPGHLFGKAYSFYVRVSCCKDIADIIQFIVAIQTMSENIK